MPTEYGIRFRTPTIGLSQPVEASTDCQFAAALKVHASASGLSAIFPGAGSRKRYLSIYRVNRADCGVRREMAPGIRVIAYR